ncbi:MAG TPA: hypothetical protein VLZ75_05605 [Chitinophagales bacterium]|nr:hypothetical protein [Chitinophagales bacterium]
MSNFPELPSIVSDIDYKYANIEFSEFKSMVYEGGKIHISHIDDSILDRINEELNHIEKSGLKDYFLLWKSIIDFCKSNQICVGPGRGVINSSLVAKCLGLTQVNALVRGLPYQRFFNPRAGFLPSFSLDVSFDNRERVIQYLKDLFGEAHIGVLAGSNDDESDTSDATMYFSPAGSGVVISDKALEPTAPTLEIECNSDNLVVDFPVKYLQSLGYFKFDIFGLKQLDHLQDIYSKNKVQIYPETWDDPKVFEYILSENSSEIFPFHKDNMREIMFEFDTNTLESLALAYALSRPSLMEYVDGIKSIHLKEKEARFLHESLYEPLESTYGYIVYKEQFLEIIVKMSGLGYDFADMMYRYLLEDDPQKHTMQFIEQCKSRGIQDTIIQQVMSELISSQPFLFSKAHALGVVMMGYTDVWHKIYTK